MKRRSILAVDTFGQEKKRARGGILSRELKKKKYGKKSLVLLGGGRASLAEYEYERERKQLK